MNINPGIVRTVALLNRLGFETTDSGDGKTNVEAGMEEALDFPHVVIRSCKRDLARDADGLVAELEHIGVKLSPQGQGPVWIEATYDPADGTALVMLCGLDDAALPGAAA